MDTVNDAAESMLSELLKKFSSVIEEPRRIRKMNYNKICLIDCKSEQVSGFSDELVVTKFHLTKWLNFRNGNISETVQLTNQSLAYKAKFPGDKITHFKMNGS